MKSRLLLFIAVSAVVTTFAAVAYFGKKSNQSSCSSSKDINDHEIEHADGFKEYAAYEFNLQKNPVTGIIPVGVYAAEMAQAMATPKIHDNKGRNAFAKTTAGGSWAAKGPTNLGGRTRAIGVDILNNNVILAGNTTGGIARTANGGTSWTNVTPLDNIKSISSIAQDTRTGHESTWYFTTGESFNSSANADGSAPYLGNGVYKSTDNGLTWARLTASNTGSDEVLDNLMDWTGKIVVDPTNGDIYVGAINSVWRSQNGGTTWANVLGQTGTPSPSDEELIVDLAISSSGRVYAAFNGGAGAGLDGIWTSTTGAASSYTRIAGGDLGASSTPSPSSWYATGNYGRVVIALAPSSQNLLYVMFYNNVPADCAVVGGPKPEVQFFVYNQTASPTPTWTDRSVYMPDETGCDNGNDPMAVQGGYDMCITVKPNDANSVVIGGTNLYISTDGFSSTSKTTRIGGYASASGAAQYANHHSDEHIVVFGSGSNNIVYCGSDGGVHKADVTATTVAWTSLNNNYQTYQYYYVALDPATGSGLAIGGAQDNGTTQINSASTIATEINSGDGASVGLSSGGNIMYSSYQNGGTVRDILSPSSSVNIEPAVTKSLFVTKFRLDPDNTSNLYYANGNDLYRTGSASTVTKTTGWTLMTGLASAVGSSYRIFGMATSRGSYSTSTASPSTLSRLYVGTDNGQLFRVDDPQNVSTSASPANITPTSMTGNGTLIDIAVDPNDSRKVMAVYSNYGVNSAWYTSDASVTSPSWSNVEGNISLLSFRSVVIVSNGTLTTYIVGTSRGIYSTTSLSGASTVWSQEAPSTIGYVPVVSIDYRPSDQALLVGSHGNGMFLNTSYPLPIRFVTVNATRSTDEMATITWTIEHQDNISKYIVQRSEDASTWTDAGTVAAIANVKDYSKNDDISKDLKSVFYRIRAVERSGDAFYSTIAKIGPNNLAKANISVYPTQVINAVNVEVDGSDYSAVLYDFQGRIITRVSLYTGINSANTSLLVSGQYILSVFKAGHLEKSFRIVKN
ncbi:MAG: hypothetical protein ABI378_15600 [Chitinophagaceae bacterium]